MDNSRRRNSSSTPRASARRPSLLTAGVRRSSRALQQNVMQELNVSLGRIPTHETPTNNKERRERRSRRQSDYQQQKDHRADRMGSIADQWESHRKSFVSEEMELETLMEKNSRYWCCGMDLCCRW